MWILKEMAMSDDQDNCIIATLYINVHEYISASPCLTLSVLLIKDQKNPESA